VAGTVENHLNPAQRHVDQIAVLIESGDYGWEHPLRLADLVRGALATTPQVGGMVIKSGDGQILRALSGGRDDRGNAITIDFPKGGEIDHIVDTIARSVAERGSHWGEIIASAETGRVYVNVRRPLHVLDVPGKLRMATAAGPSSGFIAAGVTVNNLSRLMARLSGAKDRMVYIRLGDDRILAHPLLAMGRLEGDDGNILPSLAALGDTVLAHIGNAKPPPIDASGLAKDTTFRQVTAGGERYFVFERVIRHFGADAVTVGTHVLAAKVDAPLRQLYLSGVVAIALVLVALGLAIVVSRLVTRPIRRIAEAAIAIGQLRLAAVDGFQPSMVREIDDLSDAFNRMLVGLRAFETYVPKGLVSRLIGTDRPAAITSESRELTVMFTDIAGFTAMSEAMSADEVAAFLNHHLTLLSGCIAAEGGTVDKYIGDAVMAFWGAPEEIPDAADHACRAAQAMMATVARDNEERQARGQGPVGLRIGIHTGPVVVGNIGSPERMNYTVVGDTVNTAQRLEGLGKEVDGSAQVVALISARTRAALRHEFNLAAVGDFHVKGRNETVKVYRLLG
jgi:adenylate cyclase